MSPAVEMWIFKLNYRGCGTPHRFSTQVSFAFLSLKEKKRDYSQTGPKIILCAILV